MGKPSHVGQMLDVLLINAHTPVWDDWRHHRLPAHDPANPMLLVLQALREATTHAHLGSPAQPGVGWLTGLVHTKSPLRPDTRQ